jgi:hypothetical protein
VKASPGVRNRPSAAEMGAAKMPTAKMGASKAAAKMSAAMEVTTAAMEVTTAAEVPAAVAPTMSAATMSAAAMSATATSRKRGQRQRCHNRNNGGCHDQSRRGLEQTASSVRPTLLRNENARWNRKFRAFLCASVATCRCASIIQ